MIRCHKCGYTNQSNIKKCIKCLGKLDAEAQGETYTGETSMDIRVRDTPIEVDIDLKKTILRRAVNSKVCQLVALTDDYQDLKTVPLSSENVLLNRDFLDPSNLSISRNKHANLCFKNGSWWVENNSEIKTTFIQVLRPTKLQDGDIILIGDAMFKFKESV